MIQVTKVWWDGEKLMAEPIDSSTIYPENFIDALKYDVARRDSEQAELTDWQERGMMAEAALAKLLDEKQEPAAVVSGYYGGQCVILPTDPARIFNSNTALYTTPPPCPTCEALARTVMLDQTSHDAQRKPLPCETLIELWCDASLANSGSGWFVVSQAFARAIEAAHGIGEKK